MKKFFILNGKRAAAVYAGPDSDPRAHCWKCCRLASSMCCAPSTCSTKGRSPEIDTVMMLRPTESQILWLQQFGRGLRYREGKRLKVIDYIGNHRTFLLKPRTLFALTGGDAEVSQALRIVADGRGSELLPPGCEVTYDLEALDILTQLLEQRGRGGDVFEAYYREYRERTDRRPTAAEAFIDGYDPKAVRQRYGSWFQFVQSMGDLSVMEGQAADHLRGFLAALEITPMTKSFKMVVLLAMIAEEAFPGSISIAQLIERVRLMARRQSAVRTEMGEALEDASAMRTLLEQNPIQAWVGGRGTGGDAYFRYEDGVLSTTMSVAPGLREVAASLARELAEWRLAVYVRRAGLNDGAPRIVCRVSHAGDNAILFLPSRDRNPGIPEGWVTVMADGEEYQANFVKIAVNVMHRVDSDTNVLSDLLRRWFGPRAGQPGTKQEAVFTKEDNGYRLSPWSSDEKTGPHLWEKYKRAEVPKLFGFDFKGMESQSGVITRPGLIILFVTLDKTTMQKDHKYEDAFLSPTPGPQEGGGGEGGSRPGGTGNTPREGRTAGAGRGGGPPGGAEDVLPLGGRRGGAAPAQGVPAQAARGGDGAASGEPAPAPPGFDESESDFGTVGQEGTWRSVPKLGIGVHLVVRHPGSPVANGAAPSKSRICGESGLEQWSGDRPDQVGWKMKTDVPASSDDRWGYIRQRLDETVIGHIGRRCGGECVAEPATRRQGLHPKRRHSARNRAPSL
ncbi:MAG: hypothetical protein IPP20_11305 [Gemmatimonadetes bacterium]|nr:hypothetical protein [Gemmatimonadota bacterium]